MCTHNKWINMFEIKTVATKNKNKNNFVLNNSNEINH